MLLAILIAGAILYAGVCAAAFVRQRRLMYYPRAAVNHAGITPLTVSTPAGTTLVFTRPRPGPGAVLYFGGNGEDVSLDMPYLAATFPNRSIYLFNYPGYGGSPGKPSERAIVTQALTVFDRIHAEHWTVLVIGRSLGTGVAVHLASLRPVSRLVLVTPFDSFADAAAAAHPYLPVRLLLLDKFDSWRYAPNVTAPTHIIAAENDGIIPRSSTERLRTRFKTGIVTYSLIRGVGHNDISAAPEYWPLLKSE